MENTNHSARLHTSDSKNEPYQQAHNHIGIYTGRLRNNSERSEHFAKERAKERLSIQSEPTPVRTKRNSSKGKTLTQTALKFNFKGIKHYFSQERLNSCSYKQKL